MSEDAAAGTTDAASEENQALRAPFAAWLAGRWVGDGFGGISEEVWSPPQAGSMMATYRHIKDGEITFYEFMLIVEEPDGITFRLKHFSSEMNGWEDKTESVDFPLIEATENAIRFDGLEYHKLGNDKMKIELRISDGDKTRTEIFNYTRQD